MLYIQRGLRTEVLRKFTANGKTDFDNIVDWDKQVVHGKKTAIEKFKKEKALFVICGRIDADEKGDYYRKNKSLVFRELLFIDLDELATHDEIYDVSDILKNYNHIIYPSISCREDNPRYRLVVELSRPLVEYEYKYIFDEVVDKIGVIPDYTAKTWSQCQGLPVLTQFNKDFQPIINKTGTKYPVPDKIDVPIKVKEFPRLNTEDEQIDDDKAIKIFKAYEEKNRENLAEYSYFFNAFIVLGKSVVTNEIEYDTAVKCLEILANGNEDYEYKNVQKFNYLLNTSKGNVHYFQTEHTFYSKFVGIKLEENYQGKITTNKDLFLLFKTLGSVWREENSKEKQNGEQSKPLMPPEEVAKLLIKNHYFIVIGDNREMGRVHVFDFETGLYTSSVDFIHKLIRCLDYRLTPHHWQHVSAVLKQDGELKDNTNDKYLIPCNNGVYNAKTKELEPLTPKYVFTSKIVNDYIENAPKPTFWDVDAWLSSIACGDNEVVTLLWQVINEAINPNYTRKKIGFLVGGGSSLGNNGKGTYQELIINLVGAKNVSTLKPKEFDTTQNQKFKLQNIVGKVCNIGDDIGDGYIDDVSNLMSIATGDRVTIEFKGISRFSDLKTGMFCLFSANGMPKVRNTSGWHRRVLIIPFNADFNGEKENRRIKDEYVKNKEVLEYVLYKSLQLDFETFIEPEIVKKANDEYKELNDDVLAFITNEYLPNEYHLLPVVPIGFIKKELFGFYDKERIRKTVPHNIGRQFSEKLSGVTRSKYKVEKIRLTDTQKKEITGKVDIQFIKTYPDNHLVRKV